MINISRNKGNITRETFFLKNHTQNAVEILFPDTFLKNWDWAYLWINSLKFYTVYFYLNPSWRPSKYIETKLQTTCFYFIKSFSKKTKKGLELISLPHFLHDFWRKMFLLVHSINWPKFILWLSLLREILGNMCIVIIY